jgi:small subunit ribosomal protein S2
MVNLRKMLEANVHLGHNVKQVNIKMRPYIYGDRNGIHIIDLLQTFISLEKVSKILSLASKQKNSILFVGTKPQFSSIIETYALNCNSHYITKRWLGGMLTNWSTIKLCIDNLQSFCDFLLKIFILFNLLLFFKNIYLINATRK